MLDGRYSVTTKSVCDALCEQRCSHRALERHLDPRRTVETGAVLPPPPWFRYRRLAVVQPPLDGVVPTYRGEDT